MDQKYSLGIKLKTPVVSPIVYLNPGENRFSSPSLQHGKGECKLWQSIYSVAVTNAITKSKLGEERVNFSLQF